MQSQAHINTTRTYINQTMSIVQRSIARHKQSLQACNENIVEYLKTKMPDVVSDWEAANESEKNLIRSFVQQQLAINVLSTTADKQQLECCLSLLELKKFNQAHTLYTPIIDRMSDTNEDKIDTQHELDEINSIEIQLNTVDKNRQQREEDNKQINSLSALHVSIFHTEIPSAWKNKMHIDSDDIAAYDIEKRYLEYRLTVLATTIQCYLNFPSLFLSESTQDDIQHFAAVATKHQKYIKEDILLNPMIILNQESDHASKISLKF